MAPFRALKLERDVPPSVRTLFAHVANMADVNTWFVRGCPDRARRTRWSKPVAFLRALLTSNWQSSGDQAEVRPAASRSSGASRRCTPSFPPSTSLAIASVRCPTTATEAYRAFRSGPVGRIFDALARAGRADETLIVISSDHGQTATHTHVDIDEVDRQGLSAHRGLSQVLALSPVRRGRGHGVGQLDGQRLRAWRRRLARATRFRDAGLARAGAARARLRRASGHRARASTAAPSRATTWSPTVAGGEPWPWPSTDDRPDIATSHDGADPLGYARTAGRRVSGPAGRADRGFGVSRRALADHPVLSLRRGPVI